MIHLVYGPSKSGTTSIYQALTENNMFPCLQVHGEFSEVGIHDLPHDSHFTKSVKEHFSDIIKETYEHDEISYANSNFKSYVVYIENNLEKRMRFFKFLRQFPLKIVTPLRDPFMRSVSAMVHWLDMDTISALYLTKLNKPLDLYAIKDDDIKSLGHYPIEQCLSCLIKNYKITLDDVSRIYLDVFKYDLFREYICVYFNLRTYFGFNVCLQNRKSFDSHNTVNNWHFFTFKLEDLRNVMEDLYKFLDLPVDYVFPHARNKYMRKKYIVDHEVDEIITALKGMWNDIEVPAIVCGNQSVAI